MSKHFTKEIEDINGKMVVIDTFLLTVIKYTAIAWLICTVLIFIVLYTYCNLSHKIGSIEDKPQTPIPINDPNIVNVLMALYKRYLDPDIKCNTDSVICCNMSKIARYGSPVLMLVLFYITGHYVKGDMPMPA